MSKPQVNVNVDIEKQESTHYVPKSVGKQYLHIVFNILGLYVCYIASTVAQEKLYEYRSKEDHSGTKFESGALLTFTKSLMTVIVSRMMIFARGLERERICGNAAVSSALLRAFGTIFSLYALNFISYPHAILGKSVKIIPVFIADIAFNKKQVSFRRCVSVLVTTLGMVLFSSEKMVNHDGDDTSSWIGVLLIVFSLSMDGALSVSQTKMMSGDGNPSKKPNALDTMIYMNLWQASLSGIIVLMSLLDKGGVVFVFKNPYVFHMLLVSCVIESFGQFFVYSLVVGHGTFITAFITTLRKFVTILLSIGLFGHKISFVQWIALMLVFCGIGVDIFGGNKKNKDYQKVSTVEQ